MSQNDSTTFLLLDPHQGASPHDGWRPALLDKLRADGDGLRLASLPAPPVPLKDDSGTFAGLENPTGVAIDSDGAIYVADGASHSIVKIERREGSRAWVSYYRIENGAYANDRFVYIPAVNRLERWPRSIRTEPASFDEVEVICETVWNRDDARKLVLAYIAGTLEWERCDETTDECGCSSSRESHEKKGGCGCSGSSHGKSGGCGCKGSKAKPSGGCGCSGSSSNASGTASCGCGGSESPGEGTIGSEWDDFYPAHLPAGDICKTSTRFLPCFGGEGIEPRRFKTPRGIAITGDGTLYVADSGNHRVQSFSLRGLVLTNIWGRRATAADVAAQQTPSGCEVEGPGVGDPIAGAALGEFNEPWDVTVSGCGDLYIADKGNHRVQRRDHRTRAFSAFDGTILDAHFFQVLYGTYVGKRFLFIPARGRVELWSGAPGTVPANPSEVMLVGLDVASVNDARKLVLEFLGAKGASDLLVEWERAYPSHLEVDDAFSSPSHLVFDTEGRLYVVDADKAYVKILTDDGRVLGRVTFAGEATGKFLPAAVSIDADGKLLIASDGGIHRIDPSGGAFHYDGDLHRCGCSAMAIDAGGNIIAADSIGGGVAWVPPPTGFEKSGSYITKALDSGIDRCQWHKIELELDGPIPNGAAITFWTYTSQVKMTDGDIAALADDEWHTGQVNGTDLLVMSPKGRYLWLKVTIVSDGIETPVAKRITVHYPRITYLRYLPAVYQTDPVGKDFMERFLSIFEALFSSIERKVDDLARYLDPYGVPEEFLAWLGGWVDMLFLPGWSTETRRRLLLHAPRLYKMRGTPGGLKEMIRLALGIDVRIVESFRLRRWLFAGEPGTLGRESQLWGSAIVPRLQLDAFSSIGDFSLIGTGDPLRDPFHLYAHSFKLYVDASRCRSENHERMLRYLVEREKPAHTSYELVKVEPRFRVGVQSTVGLDSAIGSYPKVVLNNCSTLGYDTLLGSAPEDKGSPAIQVGTHARVGVTAVVG